ncbi:MAG: alpha-amylase family glycosyl hydrolase [Ginsengibacter sp.]
MKTKFWFCILLSLPTLLFSQTAAFNCYPSNWWVGMKNPKLQLMVRIQGIRSSLKNIEFNYPGITLQKVDKLDGDNYIFADLVIAPYTKPGILQLKINRNHAPAINIAFVLKPRRQGNGTAYAQGVTSRDFIYLLMPDRFCNGDTTNDRYSDMTDTVLDRNNPHARHGGDLAGVQHHLGYFKNLGVTSLWLTPVFNNDMPQMKEGNFFVSGYHGYWITDHYQVDKRMGGNEAYKSLIVQAHKLGMKIIQDAVYNHIGSYHWSVLDPPAKDWINHWPSYQGTHHHEEVFIDPYTSQEDYNIMIRGWFVPHLPDLNLGNPYVANYLIQNSIWATEEFGIDGWRVDTYKYCDENFLVQINKALSLEFPSLSVFGEVTSNTVEGSAYFVKNNMKTTIRQNADGVTDYPLRNAMLDGLNQPFSFTDGIMKVYTTLAQDLLYQDPSKNCIFLDNHDQDRILSIVKEDFKKFRMCINWLFTLRGIPQLYYGTEILMKNVKNPTDAQVRYDFPGGWNGDPVNKFDSKNLTPSEDSAFIYIQTLAKFRKNSSALTSGKTMQYLPQDGVYVYFRYDSRQSILVVSNSGDKPAVIKGARFIERTRGFTRVKNIQTQKIKLLDDLIIEPKGSGVYELIK